MASTVVLVILVATLLYAILIFNGLVALKHSISKAWSNIDVLLKQRHDELPKLVETCKQYMQFERDTLEKVMAARSMLQAAREKNDVRGVGAAEAQVRLGLSGIVATAEAYPELKSNQSIQQLLARITSLENQLSDRREFYNEYVNSNNVRIEQFPDTFIARMFGFKPAALLEFSEEEKRDVDMRALFQQRN